MDGQQGVTVETVMPKVTKEDNMKLMVKKHETSRENFTTWRSNCNIFGDKVVMEESALSPTNFSKGIDATILMASGLGSDVARLSSSNMTASRMGGNEAGMLSVSTGIVDASLTESTLGGDVVEILPSSAEETPLTGSLTQYAAFLSIPSLTIKPITTRTLEGSQKAHLEGKSPELPSVVLVTTMATKTSTGRKGDTALEPTETHQLH
jgi:hypothetical protein